MTPDDFDAKLTAYALNDPGLTDGERAAIEDRLRTDAAARQTLDETRHLGHLLTKSLAAEAAAAEPSVAPAVAASLAKRSALRRWAITTASLSAAVMLAVFAGLRVFDDRKADHASREAAMPTASPALAEMADSKVLDLTNTDQGLDKQLKNNLPLGEAPPADGRTWIGNAAGGPGRPGQGFGGGGFQGGGGEGRAGGLTGGFAGVVGPPNRVGAPSPPFGPAAGLSSQAKEGTEARGKGDGLADPGQFKDQLGGDQFRQLVENPFTRVEGQDALSIFGVDVDTASYSIVRNLLTHNTVPPPDAVRLEEMVNYFPYRDAPPDGNDPFTVRVEMADCPWASKHRLARVSLKAKPIDNAKRPPSNLVFLIDVSGSMDEPNKLPLVKAALKLLVGQLGENDRVAIVVYAGSSGIVLDSTNASKKDVIEQAIDGLSAGGSTNGGSGIDLAYQTAVKNFREKGTNRVILCTDGDWNVGTTGTDALVKLIEAKRQTGVFLSVFGFGMGNLRDEMMVQLAGKGNGNYGYIDTLAEAKKAFVEQMGGTLVTVAKDVKVQIEFNPARISSYRLLGYEKRKLAAEDFHNDKKDAGEMGAGHVVTAFYELVPVGAAAADAPKVDALRYQPAPAAEQPKAVAKASTEAFVIKLRHKAPDSDKSTLREVPVGDVAKSYDTASEDFRFGSAVAAFAMLLKQSPYKGQASYALVEELAASAKSHDPGGYRAEFLELVKKAKALTKQP